MKSKKVMFLVGKFDKFSKYNAKNIIQQNIFGVFIGFPQFLIASYH